MMKEQTAAQLLLEDGSLWEGVSVGAPGEAAGEVVFHTGAVGFLETLTHPSSLGQLLLQTFPLTGNVGVNKADRESERCHAAGYIVRELCEAPSNFRCEGLMGDYLRNEGVVAIAGVDTRALTIRLREHGPMRGLIKTGGIDDRDAALRHLRAYRLTGAVERASAPVKTELPCENAAYRVAVCDLGCPASLLRLLADARCAVTLYPWDTPLETLRESRPDGLVLAGGPGDPNDYAALAERFRPLLSGSTPVFAVGLGHQLLAMAAGAAILRLPHGHRGASQPVRDLATGKVFATAQNHGYAVDAATLSPCVCEALCENVIDKTCEGILYKNIPAFSIQFAPEAFTGDADTRYYIRQFTARMDQQKGGR